MNRTECPYEEYLRKMGYIQIYDGESIPQRKNDPTSLKPGERSFFIRYYQLIKNGHFINEYVKLVFDLRNGQLRHFPEHYTKTAKNHREVKDMTKLFQIKA